MAKMPSAEDLKRLRSAASAPKVWVAGDEIGWVLNGVGPPPGHKFRAPLAYAENPEMQSADLFVSGYYKDSTVPGVPPKFSIGLLCFSKRVVGIDDGGPSSHYNKVGRGLLYYRTVVGHPQLHRIVDDSIYGYAEPIKPSTASSYWEQFLRIANIDGAPSFSLPEGQMEMDL